MNTRREPEKNRLERIGAHVRQRALTGSEASMVGFTLVVYIFAGAGAGYLADSYLETSYWIAIGTLFGAAVGFKEMFRLTKKLTRSGASDEGSSEDETQDARASQPESSAAADAQTTVSQAPEQLPAKPRIFAVPPPPRASFEQVSSEKPENAQPQQPAREEPPKAETQEEFVERLLGNEPGDELGDEPQDKTQ